MKRRIIISLGILLALCLFGDTIAMLALHRSIRQLTALAESHRIQSMRMELTANGVRIETDLLAYLAGHDHSAQQRSRHEERLSRSLRRCGSCHHPPHLQAGLDGIQETYEAYRAVTDQLFDAGDTTGASALVPEAMEIANRLVDATTEMADRAASHLVGRSTDVAASIRNAWVSLSGTLLAVLVGGGIVAFHLKGRLTRPVEGLLEGIERIGRGDLDYRFSVQADEEFRRLGDAFNRAYGDLRSAHEGMLQAEKLAAAGRLAAGIAHEVFNPLASISSAAQMMRRRGGSEQHAEQLQLIMAEVDRISRSVREMLSFSRPAASEEHRPVEIAALLEHATTLVGYDPRARSVSITRCFDSDLCPVRGDPDRLLLVFTNIMFNALDAISDGGGGTLAINAEQADDQILVAFTDDGPGMTEEQITHAFEPFFTTKEPGAGTGLGLWICYQVIQKHNATIRIDSRTGEGTTVRLGLPCDTE